MNQSQWDKLVTVETELNNIRWHLKVAQENDAHPSHDVVNMHLMSAIKNLTEATDS
jgi:hypothetical protein|tara:strand:- start:283 stop:450 length:168 start_codon:yes stop_codon:yes gene_type:complete